MSPEDRKITTDHLQGAGALANKFGPIILIESESNPAISITCAAILLSTFCAAAEMTLHDSMGIFMEVHKQTMRMAGEKK
jgi:hypothetical protein